MPLGATADTDFLVYHRARQGGCRARGAAIGYLANHFGWQLGKRFPDVKI